MWLIWFSVVIMGMYWGLSQFFFRWQPYASSGEPIKQSRVYDFRLMDSFSGKESNRFKMSDIEIRASWIHKTGSISGSVYWPWGIVLTLTHRFNQNFPDFLNFSNLNFTINYMDIYQILMVFIYNNFDYKIYGSNKSETIKTLRTVTS